MQLIYPTIPSSQSQIDINTRGWQVMIFLGLLLTGIWIVSDPIQFIDSFKDESSLLERLDALLRNHHNPVLGLFLKSVGSTLIILALYCGYSFFIK